MDARPFGMAASVLGEEAAMPNGDRVSIHITPTSTPTRTRISAPALDAASTLTSAPLIPGPALIPAPAQRQPSAPDHRFPFQNLDVYRTARALAALVHHAAIRDAELRDQATRAAKSAFLNLCEGLPDDRPAMRRKYFAAADGSLHEAVGAVDLAEAIGAVGARESAEIHAQALRLRAMLRGLLRVTSRGR